MFVAASGTVVLNVVFEGPGDCPPARSEGGCVIEDALARLDCAGASARARFLNSGDITVSAGSTSATSSPDQAGLYQDVALTGLVPGAPVHIHAAGADVPSFDVDLTIPDATFTLTNPVENALVSRSSPLGISWTTGGTAPLADVRVIGENLDGGSIDALCTVPSASPGTQVPATLLAAFKPAARSFVSLKAAVATTAHVSGWDIEVRAEGPFDLREITLGQ
jgi:hypothetical protein